MPRFGARGNISLVFNNSNFINLLESALPSPPTKTNIIVVSFRRALDCHSSMSFVFMFLNAAIMINHLCSSSGSGRPPSVEIDHGNCALSLSVRSASL